MTSKIKVLLFSKDRPMQAQATLDTYAIFNQSEEVGDIDVLYDVSNEKYQMGYDILQERMSVHGINFIQQKNFKEDVIQSTRNYDYILFLVDDCLFFREFKLSGSIFALQRDPSARVFSYRMGLNINYCYPVSQTQKLKSWFLSDHFLVWGWEEEDHDWGYPMDISCSLYRNEDIYPALTVLGYFNPNQLEFLLDINRRTQLFPSTPSMVAFEQSVAFCNPVNKVNPQNTNRAGNKPQYSTHSLLGKYLKGIRIDPLALARQNFSPNAPHMEVDYEFIR